MSDEDLDLLQFAKTAREIITSRTGRKPPVVWVGQAVAEHLGWPGAGGYRLNPDTDVYEKFEEFGENTEKPTK